jgi:hypothetical protein
MYMHNGDSDDDYNNNNNNNTVQITVSSKIEVKYPVH